MRVKSKYHSTRTVVDGVTFHSKAEAKRYGELKLLEKAGEIRGLVLQPKYPLWAHTGVVADEPKPLGTYIADFSYEVRVVRGIKPAIPNRRAKSEPSIEWEDVIEDVKGFKTALYRWKKKHVEAQYGITITEVSSR